MTHEDRVVAAARAFPRAISREEIEAILAAAYPELTAGTHWLAPREATDKMASAMSRKDTWTGVFAAARDAYLREGGE